MPPSASTSSAANRTRPPTTRRSRSTGWRRLTGVGVRCSADLPAWSLPSACSVGDRVATRAPGSAARTWPASTPSWRCTDRWTTSPAAALRVEAGRFAEAASSLSDRPCNDTVKPALLAAIANARQLAGWAAFDTGHHSDAQRHWLSAERTAVAASDLRLAARVRYCQARQFQHLHHNGDALDTLRLAHDHLAGRATPAINAMLHGAEAASLAARGDRQEALTALGAATDAFDRIDPDCEPEWMRFYDRGELLAQYGRVHRDLARSDERHGNAAVQWVTEAIAAFGPQNVRSTVLNEVGLCSGLFLAGEPQEAVIIGTRVIQHSNQLTSQRVHDRIRNLRRDMHRYATDPEVAEFSRTLSTIGSGT